MANTPTVTPPAPRKRRGWLRKLTWVAGIFIVLLVVFYFVATSSGFVKGVILPRVSHSLNADVTVSDASVSPFKQVILRNLKVQAAGQEPVLTAPEVRLRYSLLDIIGGNLHLEEVAISSPTVSLIQNADGSSNIDPILKSQKEKPKASEKKPEPASKAEKPTRIDLKKFVLSDATIRQVKNYQGGNRDTMEVSHLTMTLDDLKNGQSGKFAMGADIKTESNPPTNGASGKLEAKLKGNFDFSLTQDLKPASIKGNLHQEVTVATGALAELAGFASDLDCDMSPTEIKQIAMRFQRGSARLGEFRVSGPFDAQKSEGRLAVQILSIDKQLLNLAGAKSGLDFGPTTINSTNEIQMSKGGSQVVAKGQFNLDKLQVTRTNQTTPSLDFRAGYELTVDRGASNALLKTFDLVANEKGNPLLRAELSSPMTISWGSGAATGGDSTLNVTLTRLDLADWKPFLGDPSLAGTIQATMKLLSQQGGKLITADFDSQLANIVSSGGTNRIAQAQVKGHLVRRQDAQSTIGTMALTGLSGNAGNTEFRDFGAAMDLDVAQTTNQMQIRKLAGKLSEGGKAGGGFDLSGTIETETKAGQFTLKLTDFNQNGLRPFLEPMLADKKLTSVAINGTASAQYATNGDASLKADFQMANLVVSDPKNQFPASPLEAKAQLDALLRKQVADVRQCQLTLTPTQRAKNQLNLTGHVDMSNSKAITGNLKLAADSLDVTSYYDLFAGKKATAAATPSQARTSPNPSPSTPGDANKEPDPTTLPLRNFTADASIGRFYLREVEITNFLTTAKIDGGKVLLNPFKLALNGAPVSSTVDMDLGVPGYKYDLAFNAQAIPLAPLVNSFQPERKGQIAGGLTAHAKITGAGTTGKSLQKTLAGQFDLGTTNLNLAVVNIKSPLLKRLVNVIAAIPELAKNPASAIGAVLGKGGLSEDLAKAPIDIIALRGSAGAGKVALEQAVVQSAAFKAEAAGNVALADVLTNSVIQIPVSVSLGRDIAQKLSLAPADASTNEPFVKLPDFLTMKGTIGDPKEDINKLALAGTAFKTIGGIVSGLGGKTGGLIKSAGDLLTGGSHSTNSSSTNSTNQSPVNDLLNKFLQPKKK